MKPKFLVINGPNMNMLGIRQPEHYGTATYDDLVQLIKAEAEKLGVEVTCFQSNHEGAIIDTIHQAFNSMDGIIINPGSHSHYSIAILDALLAVSIPTVEVHISDLAAREDYRQHPVTAEAAMEVICGKGLNGYLEAMHILYNTAKTQ